MLAIDLAPSQRGLVFWGVGLDIGSAVLNIEPINGS
jgi:hypothetical protein